MSDTPKLDMLTAKQCECLELVLRHMTSKKIAMELGISPFTVNQRLDSARQKLGASTRQEAAMMYLELKGAPESFVYEAIPERLKPENAGFQEDALYDRFIPEPFVLENHAVESSSPSHPADSPHLIFAEPSDVGLRTGGNGLLSGFPRQDISRPEIVTRLFYIFGLSIAMLVMLLIAVAAGEGMTKIFHGG